MAPSTNILDDLLPLLAPRQTELHRHAVVLEVHDRAQLAELASDGRIRRYLLARLSDTLALVDPGHEAALTKALLALGHTPKMVKGIS